MAKASSSSIVFSCRRMRTVSVRSEQLSFTSTALSVRTSLSLTPRSQRWCAVDRSLIENSVWRRSESLCGLRRVWIHFSVQFVFCSLDSGAFRQRQTERIQDKASSVVSYSRRGNVHVLPAQQGRRASSEVTGRPCSWRRAQHKVPGFSLNVIISPLPE